MSDFLQTFTALLIVAASTLYLARAAWRAARRLQARAARSGVTGADAAGCGRCVGCAGGGHPGSADAGPTLVEVERLGGPARRGGRG